MEKAVHQRVLRLYQKKKNPNSALQVTVHKINTFYDQQIDCLVLCATNITSHARTLLKSFLNTGRNKLHLFHDIHQEVARSNFSV